VDSNVRACDLSAENASRNGLDDATILLRADLEDLGGGPFDLVLANPPYFSDGRIARAFTAVAAEQLAEGGRFMLVAKAIPLHRAILEERFETLETLELRGYGVFTATRPRRR
jgi:16S rRNA G1207 methylase RsmC